MRSYSDRRLEIQVTLNTRSYHRVVGAWAQGQCAGPPSWEGLCVQVQRPHILDEAQLSETHPAEEPPHQAAAVAGFSSRCV